MISCKSSFFYAALKVAPGGVSRQGSERKIRSARGRFSGRCSLALSRRRELLTLRGKRKGAKSIMPSVHNERKSASRECRVIDSRDTYNGQPEPTGASTTLPTAIQTTTHTPYGGNGGVEISTCYYGKTSTPRGLPCRQRFMFHTERTYHSQTAKAKGGRNCAIYKKESPPQGRPSE